MLFTFFPILKYIFIIYMHAYVCMHIAYLYKMYKYIIYVLNDLIHTQHIKCLYFNLFNLFPHLIYLKL